MKKVLSNFFDNYSIFALISFFIVLFSSYSLFLHRSFQTHAWDLGIFAQQTWLYGGFDGIYNTVRGTNLLSDHFGAILYLFGPIYRLFPQAETILIIQAVLVGLSAYPIFSISKKVLNNTLAGLALSVAYLSSVGIMRAIDFDFHLTTVAVFFFSFFIYFWYFKKFIWSFIFALLAMICKEDMPIYVIFASISLAILSFKDKKTLKYAIYLFLLSAICLIVIFKIMKLIPQTVANFDYFSFNYIGKNYLDAFKNFVTNPVETTKIIWYQFIQNEIKLTAFKTYFANFLYLPLLSPDIMIASAPFIITKFISEREAQWGLNGQYAVVGMFILAVATMLAVFRMKKFIKKDFQNLALNLFFSLFLFFTIYQNLYLQELNIWQGLSLRNWRATKRYDALYEIIDSIPRDKSVATHDLILPHLANRKEVYLFNCQYCQIEDGKVFDYLIFTNRYNFEFTIEGKSDSKPVIEELVSKGTVYGKGNYKQIEETEIEGYKYYLFENNT